MGSGGPVNLDVLTVCFIVLSDMLKISQDTFQLYFNDCCFYVTEDV